MKTLFATVLSLLLVAAPTSASAQLPRRIAAAATNKRCAPKTWRQRAATFALTLAAAHPAFADTAHQVASKTASSDASQFGQILAVGLLGVGFILGVKMVAWYFGPGAFDHWRYRY